MNQKRIDSIRKKEKRSRIEQREANMGVSGTIQKTYTFTHKYVMQIESGKHNTTIHYFLNDTANYIGSSIELENNITSMISVLDVSNKTATMFMTINEQKTQMSIPIDLESITKDGMEEQQVKITATGKTKTILNYTCHEYKVEGKDYFGTIWVTNDAGVSFSKVFYKTKDKKGLNQPWMSSVDGLTMKMNITDTSKRKEQHMVMQCIALEKSNLTINGSDYKKIF
ncbi:MULTISPECIES: DUF4412 domain-containing protein [unclassified Lacinutrix]